jgi:hypothetical protein
MGIDSIDEIAPDGGSARHQKLLGRAARRAGM